MRTGLAGPGEIVALAEVDAIHFGAVLHDSPEDANMHLEPQPFPHPVHDLAIEPARRGDGQRRWEVLTKRARPGRAPGGGHGFGSSQPQVCLAAPACPDAQQAISPSEMAVNLAVVE